MRKDKICLVCKKEPIKRWESACRECWDKLTAKQQNYMITLNSIREAMRDCGVDFEDLGVMW